MKRFLIFTLLVSAVCVLPAQNQKRFNRIVSELSSSKYQGRGYAKNGVVKAGRYIEWQFRKSGVQDITLQPFPININTFPGEMAFSVDGRSLTPGTEFVMREYSPGAHCGGSLYYVDTLHFDGEKLLADMHNPKYKGCFVVCDFWFTYKHGRVFKALQESPECVNAGLIYVWNTPLKFYKAYGEKVVPKPIIWVSSSFPADAKNVRVDVDNVFLTHYVSNNIIAFVPGVDHDSCFVFTAHYDHQGNMGSKLYFPGANDNASGTAAIINLAEYYVQHKPQYDMYFIALAGEETGLRGSTYFVSHPTFPLSKILYLFNLDMIGDNNPDQYVEVSPQGEEGFARMKDINAQKGYFKSFNQGKLAGNSDHYPFALRGVPCILFENEEGDAFQYYHTPMDNTSTMSFATYAPLFHLLVDYVPLAQQ